jgi:acetyl-CoA synthetase
MDKRPYSYQITSMDEYREDYRKSIEKPEAFWGSVAEAFLWRKKWDKVLDWNFRDPEVKWFINGKLNITENCIDRHLESLGEKPAIIWEPNDPTDRVRIVTYNRLHKRVWRYSQRGFWRLFGAKHCRSAGRCRGRIHHYG